jgi:endonuclease-3 related protein
MLTIYQLYQTLLSRYGRQHWWPAASDYQMLIGAILTQNTHWRNVEKAFANLGDSLNPDAILQMDTPQLAALIRPSGYHNQKAERIKLFTEWFAHYDCDVNNVKKVALAPLRRQLLALKGVGKETADCMLVYAFHKPSFVIDAYTRRLFSRIGFEVAKDYDDFQLTVEAAIPRRLSVYNEFHALIVMHGKMHCSAKPLCQGCPLAEKCNFYVNQIT